MTDIKERLWEENKSHMPVRNRVTEVEWLSRTSKIGATARCMVVYFENELDCNTILASQLYLDVMGYQTSKLITSDTDPERGNAQRERWKIATTC